MTNIFVAYTIMLIGGLPTFEHAEKLGWGVSCVLSALSYIVLAGIAAQSC